MNPMKAVVFDLVRLPRPCFTYVAGACWRLTESNVYGIGKPRICACDWGSDRCVTIERELRMSRKSKLIIGALVAAVLMPSAALASHQFTDVPDSNIFHDDIGWLADSGVTLGCNPPANDEFCPGDSVTREQMAAFMRRLASNQVVDAATVQGYAADGLTRVAYDVQETSSPAGTLLQTDITAPSSGLLVIAASLAVFGNASDDVAFSCRAAVDGVNIPSGDGYGQFDAPQIQDQCVVHATQEVDADTYTVTIDGTGSAATYERGTMTVQFLPFDGTGAAFGS